MISLYSLLILIVALSSGRSVSTQKQDYKRICYYTNWSQYRTGLGKFTPKNVDPFLCTHIVFAFAKTSGNRIEAVEWNDESTEWSKGMYARINNLKRRNPKLKTLLAIGGWTEGNAPISTMASTNESRDEFVSTTIQYLRTRGFDGLDLDWEYPGSRGGPPEDKENLIHLLKKLKSEFTKEARETGRDPLLLAIAVPVGEERINSGYNIPEVNKYVDFINLMAYDFHGAWEAQTGHHSPLFKGKAERWYAAQLNVQWSAAYWRRNGASRDKMVIGLAMYGRGYKLQYPSINGIGAQALVGSNGNSMGPFTKSKGLLAYYEVCSRLNGNGVEIWDDERRVPYMYDGSDWLGYENVRSVIEKTKWTMDHGYAGVMIWALDQDDFTGHFCKAGKYPLLSAINKTLREYTPKLLSSSLHNKGDIADDMLKYEGTTNRIVDSTSFSLTGLTSRQIQERNNIIDTTTAAAPTTTQSPTTTQIPTTRIPTTHIPTTNIPTTQIPTTNIPTTRIPSTHFPTSDLSTTTTKITSEGTSTPKTSSVTTSSTTIIATSEIGNEYNSNIESISTMVLDSNQAAANSSSTSNRSLGDSSFDSSVSNSVALELTLENKTAERLDITENLTVTISNTTNIIQDNSIMETTTSPIVRPNRMIMSLVAPSEVYYSTDIVHKGRTLLQVDRGSNDQQGTSGSGSSSGFTSVLNSLFSVLSEFGGLRGGGRRSSNQRNGNGDSSGQRNADSSRQRNADSVRSRNTDSTRQRNGEPQRQRNVDAMPMRNRDVPAQRVNTDLQRARNRLPSGSRNVDPSRQESIDPPRQRFVSRPRNIEPVETIQRSGDQTLRRTGDVSRRRNDDSVRQRNGIRRRNNEMARQQNSNGDIIRQRNPNVDFLRQRNGNADLLRQRNNDLTQQQTVPRNIDVIRKRNNAALNPRAAETLRQRIPETQRRNLQRTPGQIPNRIMPQSGTRNTVNPQFNPFQNVEMATIPQNLGPTSAQRGRPTSNNIPSLDLLETLAQGSPRIRDSRLNGRGRETNGIPNRNPTQINPGVPDISALTDMFMTQDPQNQLLQQEAVQTSITEAMLSSDFLNRASGFGGMRRSASDNLQTPDIFGNRTMTTNTQATQMQESLFNEIRNRQPSLNSNSIDTIDLSFLESQVEEGFARDRAQEIEQSMLSPGMLANGLIPNGMSGIFPQTGFQGFPGQFLPQPGLVRNSLIPRASQFQQTSMQVPETNRNTSMAVIPFNNLDRTLQQVVSTGPTFRLRNQTALTGSVLQNNVDQIPFSQNSQQALRPRGMTNQNNIVNRIPQQDNNRNRLLTSQTGLPGPLQFARMQDGTRPSRNMLGPLGPIQRSLNIPSLTNPFMSSAIRGIPRRAGPLLQANTNNNQISPNSLFFPMNPVTARASTIGSPGPPPLSSTAIQTPEEVIQRTNTIGSRSVFSQRTNSTVNIDGSMLKAEPVIPKSEILWKWEV